MPFEGAEEMAEVAQMQAREYADELAREYPYLAEVVGGYVATSGYDFADEFEVGLDVILDSLDRLRGTA